MTTVNYPLPPQAAPLMGTLLDTADVSDGIEWLHDGHDLFESYNCMEFTHSATLCSPSSKDFDQGAAWADGFPLFVYGGVVCKSVGLDQAEMKAEVTRVFNARESLAVEQGLMANGFVSTLRIPDGSGGLDDVSPEDVSVDLTPTGGAVKPALGLAILEGYAARHYAGTPVIHTPVAIASLLMGVAAGAVLENKQIHTKLGSAVVAGAGYDYPNLGPDGTEAADGEKWLYATGGVVIKRQAVPTVRQVMDRSVNDVFVLAERGYYVAVDCMTAAIRVQETA